MMDVNVYLGKEMIRSDGETGQKYEVVIYPAPNNHKKVAEIIKTAIEWRNKNVLE